MKVSQYLTNKKKEKMMAIYAKCITFVPKIVKG